MGGGEIEARVRMGGGEIEALVSGFTKFAIWKLKQVFYMETRRWRDDLMKISFGERQSDGQVILFLQTQKREVWVQEDVFSAY